MASSGCLSFQLCIDIRRCEGDIQSSYFISKVFVSIQSSPTFVFSAISLSKLLIFGDLVQFRLRNLRREGMQSTPTARLGFRGSVLGSPVQLKSAPNQGLSVSVTSGDFGSEVFVKLFFGACIFICHERDCLRRLKVFRADR